jgi:hypothetical protein
MRPYSSPYDGNNRMVVCGVVCAKEIRGEDKENSLVGVN